MTSTAPLLDELTSAAAAVRGQGWVSAGLGQPGAPVDLLGATGSPLSALAGAGLDWFTPFVAFLEEPLDQLRGDPGPVTSSARDFGGAGQEITALARSYRDATGAQTSGWSGGAAADYRDAGARHADGIAALGQASGTVASAIAGAGEVVGQAVEAVTQLIAEAAGKIIPIMSEAVAAAPATFGQSIAEAIPVCVQIAVEYGQKILAKLGALLASGQNLLKLVQGALAVVDVVKQVLAAISHQSTQGGTAPAGNGAGQQASGYQAATPPSWTGGFSVAPQSFDSSPLPYGSEPGHGSGVAATASAGNGPAGIAGRPGIGPGAEFAGVEGKDLAAGRPSTGSAARAGPAGTGMGGAPVGAGGAQGAGDKEHRRRYSVPARPDELFGADSPVIGPGAIGE